MENIKSYNVARRYEKRALLIAVNLVAGLSIFFFGYDQGVMGGVNGNRNYASTMGFGAFDDATGIVAINKPLLQGGIVSSPDYTHSLSVGLVSLVSDNRHSRSQCTTYLGLSSAPFSAAGSAIATVVSRPSL